MLQRLAFLLLQKGRLTRWLAAICFLCLIASILSMIEIEEHEIPKQDLQTNPMQLHREVLVRFHSYKLKSRCKKEFCLKREMQALLDRNPSLSNNQNFVERMRDELGRPKGRALYALYFSCQDTNCYEFIRELELLGQVFILKAQSFNTEILYAQPKEAALERLEGELGEIENLIDDLELGDTGKQRLPMHWRQTVLLFFEIQRGY